MERERITEEEKRERSDERGEKKNERERREKEDGDAWVEQNKLVKPLNDP